MPLVNPVFAAKSCVTADHVGRGRFGLNVVSGWNVDEFAMFGAQLLEHDDRYGYSEEWVSIVKKIWSEEKPFDYSGRHFNVKNVGGKPKPFGGTRPLLMSAGSSPAGRAFASRHVDCLFMVISDEAKLADEVAALRAGQERSRRFRQRPSDVPGDARKKRRTTTTTWSTRKATGRRQRRRSAGGSRATGARCRKSACTR